MHSAKLQQCSVAPLWRWKKKCKPTRDRTWYGAWRMRILVINKVECSADLSFICIHRAKQHSGDKPKPPFIKVVTAGEHKTNYYVGQNILCCRFSAMLTMTSTLQSLYLNLSTFSCCFVLIVAILGGRSEYDYPIIWSIEMVVEWVIMDIDFQSDSYFSHQRCLQATQAYRLCWLDSVST